MPTYAAGSGVAPSLPSETSWCGASERTIATVSPIHSRNAVPAFIGRGSLASSHAMMVGSSRYATPVSELVRCRMYRTCSA